MNRRSFHQTLGVLPAAMVVGCGGGTRDSAANQYRLNNLVSDTASASTFKPAFGGVLMPEAFVNAWGIAIRPAGAGGHFWVTAGKYSYQFLGDVSASSEPALRPLQQDGLKLVEVPGVAEGGFSTGTVFNGAALDSKKFWVTDQPAQVDGKTVLLSGSARFLFATDSGVISGWTERNPASLSTPVRVDGPAVAMIDDSANQAAFFGMAIRPDNWSTLWVADFGANPRLRQYNDQWQEVPLQGFVNPFATGVNGVARPGDYVPFNVQVLMVDGVARVLVAYAKSQADPDRPSQFLAAEEDAVDAQQEGATPDRGKVLMFSLDGTRLKTFDDRRLNAPWGLAIAPPDFGALSNTLLVGNFGGSGRIAAYDVDSGRFVDWLADTTKKPIAIPGLWGLQFGNGASLGDANALYFAAGPNDETQGLFGSLRYINN
nr:TIGR03118 family protein [uncultured Rhodoferax sp.]